MLLLKTNQLNKIVCTVSQNAELATPEWLFSFTHKMSKERVTFILPNISTHQTRYDQFEFIEGQGAGEIAFPYEGQYIYGIYEQYSGSTNLNPALAYNKVESGLALLVAGSAMTTNDYYIEFISNDEDNSNIIFAPGELNPPSPTPSVTASPTQTPSQTATNTPSPTQTPSMTQTVSVSNTSTQTPTVTSTPTRTPSQTPTQTPTNTASNTPTQTQTKTPTNTPTQTKTPTATPTNTPSNTASNTPTQTQTKTPTNTPTQTATPSQTPSNTPTQTPTQTQTKTPTPSITASPTQTQTMTPTPSITASPTVTPTPSITASQTPTQTQTQTQTNTPTPSITASQTNTPTPSQTATVTPSITSSATPTLTPTPSSSPLPSSANIRFWIDASDTSTITKDVNNKVSQWNDKGPNGYNLLQSNSNNQPVYTSSTLNAQVTGLPCVSFNGLNTSGGTFMSVSGISFSDTGYTYFFVAGISRDEAEGFAFSLDGPTSSPTQEANYYLYSQNQGSGTDRVFVGADNTSWYANLESNSGDTISRSSGLFLGVVTGLTNSTSQVQLNGVTLSLSQTASTSDTITSIAVGGPSGSTSQFLALSEVMEVLVYDTVLNSAQISIIQNNLQNKWMYSQWLVTPTPTPSVTATATMTPTNSPTPSITPSQTTTQTPSMTASPTNTPTPSPTAGPSPTPTNTATVTPSPTPPFNPATLSPQIWVDFSDTSTMTFRSRTNFLSKITNKGVYGSLTAFTQTTAANQPLVTGTTQFSGSGLSAVTISNDFVTSIVSTSASTNWTKVIVSTNLGNNASFKFDDGTGGSYGDYMQQTSTSVRKAFFAGGAYYRRDCTLSNRPTTGQTFIDYVSTSGVSIISYSSFNGSGTTESVVAGSNYGTAAQNKPPVSTLYLLNDPGDGTTYSGEIGEMYFFTRELTSTETTNLLNYLKTKWNLKY